MPPRSAKQKNKSDVWVHDDHDVPPVANGTHVLIRDKQDPLWVQDSILLPRLPVTSRSKSYPLSTTHPGSMVTNLSSEAPIPLKRKREAGGQEAEKSRSSVPEKTIELTASGEAKALSSYALRKEKSRQRLSRLASTESTPNSISVRDLAMSSNRNPQSAPDDNVHTKHSEFYSDYSSPSSLPPLLDFGYSRTSFTDQNQPTFPPRTSSSLRVPHIPSVVELPTQSSSASVPPLPPLIRVEDIPDPTELPIYQMPYGYSPFLLPVLQFGMTPYGLPCHNSAEHPDSFLSHPSLDPLARSLYPGP